MMMTNLGMHVRIDLLLFVKARVSYGCCNCILAGLMNAAGYIRSCSWCCRCAAVQHCHVIAAMCNALHVANHIDHAVYAGLGLLFSD
jgi:hypothetical protein